MDPELEKWLREINNRVYDVQRQLQRLESQVQRLLVKTGLAPAKDEKLPWWREGDIKPEKGG